MSKNQNKLDAPGGNSKFDPPSNMQCFYYKKKSGFAKLTLVSCQSWIDG